MTNPNQRTEANEEPSGAYFFAQIRSEGNYQLALLLGRGAGRDVSLSEVEALYAAAEVRKQKHLTAISEIGDVAISASI